MQEKSHTLRCAAAAAAASYRYLLVILYILNEFLIGRCHKCVIKKYFNLTILLSRLNTNLYRKYRKCFGTQQIKRIFLFLLLNAKKKD